MAIDPEELSKRRQLRKQQRQTKKRKRIVRFALIAIAVFAVVALVIVLISSRPGPKPGTQATADATALPDTVIHLAAAGDLNVTEKVVAAGGSSYDYTNAFIDVLPVLSEADMTVLNFEGNFYGAPYGADRSAPAELAQALDAAGVDVVQLANSYSIYKGMDGLARTINTLKGAGLEPLGVYATAAEARAEKGYMIKEIQGIKIAFVAFTKGMDGMALPEGNAGCVNLLYTDYSTDYQQVDTAGITKILDAVNKESPDLTVAMLHWGSEYNNNISETQTKICELLQEKGVDAILGTHSHYVQKIDFNPQNGTFVAYSLGDFFSDAAKAGSEYSIILDLEITKSSTTGQTQITNYTYTPIFTVAEPDKPLRVVRIAPAMKAYDDGFLGKVTPETYEAMNYALTRIEARITGK